MSEKEKLSWVIKSFETSINEDPELAAAVAAVRVLTQVIKISKATTLMELQRELELAETLLKESNKTLSVSSGCELFTRFVTRTSLDIPDFVECKNRLIERGEHFSKKSAMSREKIGQLASTFFRDGITVLVHGFSRVVLAVLLREANQGIRFRVIVTEARPDQSGYKAAKKLSDAKIPVTLIMDSAVAHIMGSVDLVLVGAEGIVENGGIINMIGTYNISIIAKAFKKPFYVASESFKFMRLYPLNQRDLHSLNQSQTSFSFWTNCSPEDQKLIQEIEVITSTKDYTPPSYITLLFTEIGILTPSAVSDELIKLYYE